MEGRSDLSRQDAVDAVRRVWSDVLGVAVVDGDTDFFDVGGHSLLVLDAIDGIEERTGVAIPLRYFFEHPRIADLAAYVSVS